MERILPVKYISTWSAPTEARWSEEATQVGAYNDSPRAEQNVVRDTGRSTAPLPHVERKAEPPTELADMRDRHIYVRAEIRQLRLTAVVSQFASRFDHALVLCPKLAQEVGLSELDWVGVRLSKRREPTPAYIVLGRPGQAEWWKSADKATQPYGVIGIFVYGWRRRVPPEALFTQVVLTNARNAPISIRRLATGPLTDLPPGFPVTQIPGS